jgi:sugar lactone lactonase YvrE
LTCAYIEPITLFFPEAIMPFHTAVRCSFLLLLGLAACKKDNPSEPTTYATVSTLAGTGIFGFVNGPGVTARFSAPQDLAIDSQGTLYVAESDNNCVRKITAAGVVSTLAGGAHLGYVDGPAASAFFNNPTGVAVDAHGMVYVADQYNHCIRRISPAGVVTTLAGTGIGGYVDGPAATAQFAYPQHVAVDAQGTVYVADTYNSCLRKISPSGVVSTLAGSGRPGYVDGTGLAASFASLGGLALDKQGTLYVAEYSTGRIRRVSPAGVVTTLAGTGQRGYVDGPARTAQFNGLAGLAIDAQGTLYIAEQDGNRLRQLTTDGTVRTLAGTGTSGHLDGAAGTAQLGGPTGLALDAAGTLYFSERNQYIRQLAK